MTEAAQANLGGLECSSYTWQVRQKLTTLRGDECQERSTARGVAKAVPPTRKSSNYRVIAQNKAQDPAWIKAVA